MKALEGAFNQERAQVGALSVIVKPMDRMQHYPGHQPLPRRLGAAAGREGMPLLPVQRPGAGLQRRRRRHLQLSRWILGGRD